ncbi:hypothetical protein GW17_00032414, partial [Ensete ventricosum]
MGSYSFEEEEYASDQPSDSRVGGSYSPSADVSGSEYSSEISGGGFPAASASAPSAGASLLPGGDVPFWEAKLEKRATDVSATVFGELWRLEPLAPQKQTMWRREMEWLLSVSDFIVELVPSIQEFPRCGTFEVMVSRPRADLHINLPALKRLDAMLLLGILEGFRDTEFWYVDRGIMVADADEYGSGSYPPSSSGRPSLRQEEKWWLPVPRVPPNGLSKEARKRLQQSRDCANQILKAAMAINRQSILESYSRVMESLAFNIVARIDDLIFVDDATKKCAAAAAAEAISVFNRGGLGGLPLQRRISHSPFSIQNTPHVSSFATPSFCSSTPTIRSPVRM